jgi:Flp pilus assembly protein TadG
MRGQNGQVLVFLALSMVVLLGITGLAIDAGVAYGVKAKLSSAVDAAALAAADATGNNSNDYAAAKAAGAERFNANFRSGYLDSSVASAPAINVLPNTPNPGEIQVTVTASATAPTTFMQVLGLNKVNASATAQTVKKDLDMVFVIDNTGSLDTGGVPAALKAAAKSFVDRFNPDSDRVGLIKFAYGSVVSDPIRTLQRGFDKSAIENDIDHMNFSGSTNFSEAFWDAKAQLDSIPPPSRSSYRVIVFFSDGSPNSFSATFSGSHPGVIISGDSPSNPTGLDKIGSLSNTSAGYNVVKSTSWSWNGQATEVLNVTTLPAYATWPSVGGSPAGPPPTLFQVTSPPSGTGMAARAVNASYGSDPNYGFIDVNNAARNLPEEMANNARASGIYVYTLGLGDLLTQQKSWGNNEKGNAVLMNMANDADAPNHGTDQPTGLYAYAADETELQQAFDEIASQLLRLTR